jgi:dGTPase
MAGWPTTSGVVVAAPDAATGLLAPGALAILDREAREAAEHEALAPGATRAEGAGRRSQPEEPDPWRTCFERDRDRILHSKAFRRLAGKTQVYVWPRDHQRTRLTHALEVAQVATAVARALKLNVALTEAIALGHDCGHTPGGHAGERALAEFLPTFHHAPWGADVVLAPLNLCEETLDGIRCHSWDRPAPATPEGLVVRWADRIAYCTHDFEDAVAAGIVAERDLPAEVADIAGTTRARQLDCFIGSLVATTAATGTIGMAPDAASALAALRAFNYERIYTRPASLEQAAAVVEVIQALVEHFVEHPEELPNQPGAPDHPLVAAVAYVAGMTDRFAFETAVGRLGWAVERLPRGIDSPQAASLPAWATGTAGIVR